MLVYLPERKGTWPETIPRDPVITCKYSSKRRNKNVTINWKEDLFWAENDNFLLSGSTSGAIYVWKTLVWEKHFEHYPTSKKVKTLSIEFDGELNLLVYSTSDGRIKMFYEKGNISVVDYWLEKYILTTLKLCKKEKILFAGTDRGSIGKQPVHWDYIY